MTPPQLAAPLLRISLGAVALFHALRFLGAFTRDSATDRVADLASKVGAAGLQQPTVIAWVLVIALAVGGLGLLLGAFTRVANGLVFAVCVLGLLIRPPVWEVHTLSDVDRLGVELLLVLAVQSVAVHCLGPGALSVDASRARSPGS